MNGKSVVNITTVNLELYVNNDNYIYDLSAGSLISCFLLLSLMIARV